MNCRGLLLGSTLAALLWGGARADADIIVVENGVPDVLRIPAGSGTPVPFATANLDSPIGVNVDASNNVYVVNQGASSTSTFHDSVAKFSPTGSPLGFFVTPATPPGNTLNAPVDIAFDGAGKAYVTSGAAPNPPYGYVAQYDAAGHFLLSFGLANTNMPTGVGYNPANGLLYVVNGAAAGDAGPNVDSFLIYNPANIAAAPTIVTPTGAGALDGGQQVAFDPAGHVFIASNGKVSGVASIQEYDAAGNYVATIDSRANQNAEGVAYDPTTKTLYASYLGSSLVALDGRFPPGPPTSTSGYIEQYQLINGTFVDKGALATGLNFPAYLTYQPVPEPSGAVLTGLGLVALAGARRRGARAVRAA